MLKRSMFWAAIVALAATTPATADLIAHWEFDNANNVGEATLSDDLTVVGDASYSANGKIGGALALDGSGDYLHLDDDALPTDIPTGNSSYSVAAWIKTGIQGKNGIVGWGNPNTLQFNGSRTGTKDGLHVQNYSWGTGNDIIRNVNYADDTWHHFAATYNASTLQKTLYWDGVQLGDALTLPAAVNVAAENFQLGAINNGFDEEFTGMLDDVRIYNHALTGDEVADLVPEPSTWTLLGIGLLGLLGWRRRFRS